MKKRIITAVVLIPVLVLVVLVAPKIVAAIVWGLLLMVGVYELLYATGLVRHVRMVLYSALMAMAISLWSYLGAERSVALLGLLVFWILLFSELMANHVKISLEMVMDCFFAGAVVPYLLSSLIRILSISTTGRYLIPIPFVVAFLSDAGAAAGRVPMHRAQRAGRLPPGDHPERPLPGCAAIRRRGAEELFTGHRPPAPAAGAAW